MVLIHSVWEGRSAQAMGGLGLPFPVQTRAPGLTSVAFLLCTNERSEQEKGVYTHFPLFHVFPLPHIKKKVASNM